MSRGREIENTNIQKNFDWKLIFTVIGIIVTVLGIISSVVYFNTIFPHPIFSIILGILVSILAILCICLLLFFLSYLKKSTNKEVGYRSREFKKLYFNYVKRYIEDLEKFYRFTFIKSRTCSKVKWDNRKRFVPDENNAKYTVDDIIESVPKSESNIVVIMGEMGIGKSVFSLKILKQNIANKKLTIHIQLSQFADNIESDIESQAPSLTSIVEAMLKANERLSNEARKENAKNSYEKFKLGLETYLKEQKCLIIFEGVDEFKGKREIILTIAKSLVDLKHLIIITGRNYSILQLGINFESSRPTFIEFFELNLLQPEEVEPFVEEFAGLEHLTNIVPLDTMKSIIQPSENYPELNYRNPLVIQAIAYSYSNEITNENFQSRKLNTLDILKEISYYIFRMVYWKRIRY